MNAGQKSARRIAAANVLSRDTICNSCLLRLSSHTSRRNASAAAVAVAEESPRTQTELPNAPVKAQGLQKAIRVSCSPVLSRPPLITRDLTSFEKAFYLYQKRLNERLVLPFTRYFYIKRRTPAEVEWKRKVKARRGTAARDVGLYNAYDKDAWNDEALVGSKFSEPEDIVDKLIRDAEGKDIIDAELQGDAETGGEAVAGDAKAGEGMRKPVNEVAIERPLPRTTEADETGDVRSLARALDKTLYLLVKNQQGEWRFPEDRVHGRENLHQAAERILLQVGGMNMNTWVVGNHPVGHFIRKFMEPITAKITRNRLVSTSKDFEQEEYGEKVFFMKSRIMAGQADMSQNEFGDTDFQWLTKEEIQQKVHKGYWDYIRNMLPSR
ncbi:related to mitochondrial ribosomal L17 [Lecanosticta acicola]|uniref:Large ribosomal subunit protein mL46 n=1 Tax=Lecanosticta acicola TaxID=111012 RepID=A0AAI9EAD8_9PEZI|nr:related to mitochondrial ribosomal L17 [Lecanosticta acicola]